jgi:ABC-type proline/glycine betaine transport system ATPase subunit
MIPVVLVTHDRAEALGLADRLIIYAGGRIEQTGTPREVLTLPKTELVEHLLAHDWDRLSSRLLTAKGTDDRARAPLLPGLPMAYSR